MELKTVPVSQCLDKRLLIFGYEIPDVLAIFITLSVLNFIFGQLQAPKFFLVWCPTMALAAILRIGKKDKPDNYLVHWIRFQVKPGVYSAFAEPTGWITPPRSSLGGVR